MVPTRSENNGQVGARAAKLIAATNLTGGGRYQYMCIQSIVLKVGPVKTLKSHASMAYCCYTQLYHNYSRNAKAAQVSHLLG